MEDLKNILTLIGLMFVVVQLFFGLRLFKGNLHNKIYDEIHKTHKPFLDHPELRPYFHHNAKFDLAALDDKTEYHNYLRARAVAEIYFDVFENIYILTKEQNSFMLRVIPYSSPTTLLNIKAYMTNMIKSSYFLASYLNEVEDTIHPDGLNLFIRRIITENWVDEDFDDAKKWLDKIA